MHVSKIKDSIVSLANSAETADLGLLRETITTHFKLILDEIFAIKQADPLNGLFDRSNESELLESYLNKNLQFPVSDKANLPIFSVVGNVYELLTFLNNTVQMTYDLGCAYHSKMYVLKEQVLDILIAGFDGQVDMKVNQIFVNVNGKLNDSNERLDDKYSKLVDCIFWEIDNYLPYQKSNIDNVIYRSIWLKKKTVEIAELTKSFYLNEALKRDSQQNLLGEGDKESINFQKIVLISNLLKTRFHQKDNVENVLFPIMNSMNWSEKNKLKLSSIFHTRDLTKYDLTIVKNKYFSELLLAEMTIWARRKNEIDRGERLYLYQIARELNYDHYFIDGLLF